MPMILKRCAALALFALLAGLAGACTFITPTTPATTTTTTTHTPTSTATYNVWELRYAVFAMFPDYFWCDPDFYPIARPGSELASAQQQFPAIKANQQEFAAILRYLGLDTKDSYTPEEQLLIYRQHKKLTLAVQFTGGAPLYNFVIRTGEGQGWRYEGAISSQGQITVTKKDPSFNTCPICLSQSTLIDMAAGQMRVEDIAPGMSVWTMDENGERVAEIVLKTVRNPVPEGWLMVKITLADGRVITASPGHPSIDNRSLGSYKTGEVLDGSVVISLESVPYSGVTYDILPAGATGYYWANSVLLGSTLK